jgi:hypothetical protein
VHIEFKKRVDPRDGNVKIYDVVVNGQVGAFIPYEVSEHTSSMGSTEWNCHERAVSAWIRELVTIQV